MTMQLTDEQRAVFKQMGKLSWEARKAKNPDITKAMSLAGKQSWKSRK